MHPPSFWLALDEASLSVVREECEVGAAGLALRVHARQTQLVREDEDGLAALHWRTGRQSKDRKIPMMSSLYGVLPREFPLYPAEVFLADLAFTDLHLQPLSSVERLGKD